MATIQKTTLKRFNGTDWDPVYLANSADISYIGTGFEVASGTGFEKGEAISASASTYEILKRTVEGLTAVMKDKIPALEAGTSLSSVDVKLLKGVIDRANLPADVGGKGKEVASEDAKAALTKTDVNIGDIVKVTGGKVYLVTAVEPMAFMELSDSASEIAWSRITGHPTTLAGYGITDELVAKSEKVTTASAANAGKILVLNDQGKLDADVTGSAAKFGGQLPEYYTAKTAHDALAARVTTNEGDITTLKSEMKAIDAAWITSGIISIDRLPATAVERVYVAKDEDARQALTTEQVQNGDTVKVTSTGKMFFVVDDTKLGTAEWADAFMEYSAGVAGSVDWSGVTNKPNTLAGYGITDELVKADEVATTATANKLLKLDGEGKLAADVTGSAAKLGGQLPTYYATAQSVTEAGTKIEKNATDIKDLQDAVGIGGGTAGTSLRDDVTDLKGRMTTAETDITNLKAGTAITALAAAKITGTLTRAQLPADISGRLFTKADLAEAKGSLTKETAAVGDIVKCADGKVYVITNANSLDADEGYTLLVDIGGSDIQWSQIKGVPTTLAAMNWADAVTTAMLADEASKANAGKLLKIGADGKLKASITGDAMSLNGHADTYFATKEEHDALNTTVTDEAAKVTELQGQIKAIDAGWITTGKIDIERLPHGALERCVVVKDDAKRKALTKNDVQNGDTVKVTDTGLMYFVVDDNKLAEDAGYEVYTAGTASAVDWSGITNKPTTLVGYGITDAVASSEKVTVASATNKGKILVLNDAGKLDVDITGSVAWGKITGAPTSTVTAIDAAVEAATHSNRAVLDKLSEVDGVLAYNGKKVATAEELSKVSLGALQVVDTAPTDAAAGQLVLEAIK